MLHPGSEVKTENAAEAHGRPQLRRCPLPQLGCARCRCTVGRPEPHPHWPPPCVRSADRTGCALRAHSDTSRRARAAREIGFAHPRPCPRLPPASPGRRRVALRRRPGCRARPWQGGKSESRLYAVPATLSPSSFDFGAIALAAIWLCQRPRALRIRLILASGVESR